MWHEQAKPFVESGELAVLGVVQEQHADRAQLYKQWKQYDFPIIQDATTQLNLAAVPIPILIDEHGVVRNNRPKPGNLKSFLKETFDAPADQTATSADNPSAAASAIARGNAALHSRDNQQLTSAIQAFTEAVKLEPKSGKAVFGLGVAYRARFDSPLSEKDDFANASRYWSEALSINPNQYIWRRRIEQYGPRQIKPYPFYDWVGKAITEIKQRGEEPVKIVAPLTDSEMAKPSREFSKTATAENPDPESKINTDDTASVKINSATVPAIVAPGKTVRVYLNFDIDAGKWNDEATPLKVWIDESSTGTPEMRLLQHNPENANSNNTKQVDFEFATAKDSAECTISGYALYHTCDDDGVCYYYRQNFKVPVMTK